MFDFRNIEIRFVDAMRYDTPADYFFEGDKLILEVWSGLPPLYQQECIGHELQELPVLLSAGMTIEQIDTVDNFMITCREFSDGEANVEQLAAAVIEYQKVPVELRDLYELIHNQAILWGRTFLEAQGKSFKEEEEYLISIQGKIPLREKRD